MNILIITALFLFCPQDMPHFGYQLSGMWCSVGWNQEVRGQREWFCNHLSAHTCFLLPPCICIPHCALVGSMSLFSHPGFLMILQWLKVWPNCPDQLCCVSYVSLCFNNCALQKIKIVEISRCTGSVSVLLGDTLQQSCIWPYFFMLASKRNKMNGKNNI